MLGTFVFKTCGARVTPTEQWLSDLLSLYGNGEIDKGELFRSWLLMHDRLGVPVQGFLDFAHKCLEIWSA